MVRAHMTSIRTTGSGTKPKRSPLPNERIAPGIGFSGTPPEITSASPRAALSIARVAMNGGRLPRVISSPFVSPASAPAPIPSASAATSGRLATTLAQPKTIPASPKTLPTERSMPPETITKVWPRARMAITAIWVPTLKRLLKVRKYGERMVITTHRIMSPQSGPLRERISLGLILSATLANGGLAPLCRERHDLLLAGFLPGELARDAAPRHHQYPVAQAQHLREIARYHQDTGTVLCELVHQLVDLHLRPHVYPTRRLVHDQDLRVRQEPLPDDHLLLVAAGEVANFLFGTRCPYCQLLDHLLRPAPLLLAVDEPRAGVPTERGERQVLGHRERRDDPLPLPVLRDEPYASVLRLAGIEALHPAPLHPYLTGIYGVRAKDRARQLRSASPDYPGDPDHLAGAHLEGDVLKYALARKFFDLQQDLPDLGPPAGKLVLDGASHHHPHELLVVGCGRHLADQLPVPQDGYPVPDLGNLLEVMGDKDHTDLFLLEAAHYFEEALDLLPESEAVGSSMIKILASRLNAFAISTICRCATPRVETRACESTRTLILSRSSCASSLILRRSTIPNRLGWRPRKMFSATVSCGTRLNSW